MERKRFYLFIVSMADIPVWIISSGYIRDHGLIGWPTKVGGGGGGGEMGLNISSLSAKMVQQL